MSVKLVDFGRLDAESDRALSEYFVDIGIFEKIRQGRISYIIGRKGSGKTAIFQTANERNIGHHVIKYDFEDYPWEIHKAIQDYGVPNEAAFVSSWRFFFYVSICKYWGSLPAIGNVSAAAKNYLGQIYGSENPENWKNLLIDKFKRVRKIDLPSMDGVADLGGIELDEAVAGPLLAQSIGQWSNYISDFVQSNWRRYPVTLIIDRLDDGWDASEKSKQLLIGVLKATRDVNLNLVGVRRCAAPVITLLRSDIYDNLQFNDKNKMNADTEFLDWSPDSLIDVINARISRSLGCEKSCAWSLAFSSSKMRQGTDISSYLIKRTMLRPRDLVAFCIKCQEVANKNNSIVETADVYTAEEAYSRYMYDELDDEMHKQISDSRQLMQVIRDIGITRFNFEQWNQAINARSSNLSSEQSKDKLKILFDYSIIGIPRSGGKGGGTKTLYIYNDRLLEPDFRSDMAVHLSLKKALKMTEPRQA